MVGFVATVERVTGGNDIVALPSNGAKLRIRLLGMDTPQPNRTRLNVSFMVHGLVS